MRSFIPVLLVILFARAERFEVRALDRDEAGAVMVFEPDHLRLRPGDTGESLAAHPTYNAATIPELQPPGAGPFKGHTNQEIEVAFDVPGTYVWQPEIEMWRARDHRWFVPTLRLLADFGDRPSLVAISGG